MLAKLIYVILDGASDGIEYDKTVLDIANTSNLAKLASLSKGGIVYPIEKGIAPESDAATLSMLGYNPKELKIARGVLEALGAGINFEEGDLALRGNFATVKDNEVIDRRVGRSLSDSEAKILIEEVRSNLKDIKGYKYELVHTIGHRCVLVIKKKDRPFASKITNIDPAYVRIGDVTHAMTEPKKEIEFCKPLSEDSLEAAELVNTFFLESKRILSNSEINVKRKISGKLEANAILLRDAGSNIPKVQNFSNKYGFHPICIADMPVELGIARLLGMDYVWSYGLSYKEKAELVIKQLENYDFVFVHLKGADEPGHDGDFNGKLKAIESIDNSFFKPLLENLDLNKTAILVTCDHSTPPELKAHSDSPVPFIFYNPSNKADLLKKFSEKECMKGSFGVIQHGYLLLDKLLKST